MKVFQCGLCIALFTTLVLMPPSPSAAGQQDGETAKSTPADGKDKPKKVDYTKLKSPVPFSAKSIKRGQVMYKRLCVECHGYDGKSQIDVIADASDLTEPEYYYHGSTEGEVFRSIRNGAGENMPPYKDEVRNDKDIWDLVNFTRSLWPAKLRPKLQDDADDRYTDETKPSKSNDS
jgi:mono/diheme cytochrome c family protein